MKNARSRWWLRGTHRDHSDKKGTQDHFFQKQNYVINFFSIFSNIMEYSILDMKFLKYDNYSALASWTCNGPPLAAQLDGWMDSAQNVWIELGLTLLVLDFRWLQKLQQRQGKYDWWWMTCEADLWSPSSPHQTVLKSSMPCVPKKNTSLALVLFISCPKHGIPSFFFVILPYWVQQK